MTDSPYVAAAALKFLHEAEARIRDLEAELQERLKIERLEVATAMNWKARAEKAEAERDQQERFKWAANQKLEDFLRTFAIQPSAIALAETLHKAEAALAAAKNEIARWEAMGHEYAIPKHQVEWVKRAAGRESGNGEGEERGPEAREPSSSLSAEGRVTVAAAKPAALTTPREHLCNTWFQGSEVEGRCSKDVGHDGDHAGDGAPPTGSPPTPQYARILEDEEDERAACLRAEAKDAYAELNTESKPRRHAPESKEAC
jgi:hypothetical protein